MAFVVVPHPMGMIPKEDITRKADEAFPEIMKLAINWKPTAKMPPPKDVYPADILKFKGTSSDVGKFFFEQGWSLGLPIVPPNPEAVAKMLKGTSLPPDHVIGIIPPRMATLTVQLAAVHAVMAGCEPDYLPVVIAVWKALLQLNWQGATTSTATTSPLVIVNGPIVKELGIAATQGSAGAEHQANASIGYCINLIADIVGGSKAPSPDKSTLGSPADFVCWIFGENEDALPQGWKPFHVDRGFKPEDSVVTVMVTLPPVENMDHWSANLDEHLTWWGSLARGQLSFGGAVFSSVLNQPHIIGVGPEHAKLAATAGVSKEQYCKAFWEKTQTPLSAWPKATPALKGWPKKSKTLKQLEKMLGKPLNPDSLIPITLKPELLWVVIAGGAGKHSHFFPPFFMCNPISQVIER